MTEPSTASTAPAWTVVAQSERTIVNAQGSAIDVMQVSFQLPDGTQGSVNVPLTSYTVDNVKAAIAAKAATLSAVNALAAQ